VSEIPAISNAVGIAAGTAHSLAVLDDGSVIAWGNDLGGQCLGATNAMATVAVAGANSHSLALRSDGSVVAWGTNNVGQLDVPVGLRASGVDANSDYTLALSGPLDPLDYDSDDDGLLDGEDLTVDSSDSRYQNFATAGIVYTTNGTQRTFKGEITAQTDPFNWQSSGVGMPDGFINLSQGFSNTFPPMRASNRRGIQRPTNCHAITCRRPMAPIRRGRMAVPSSSFAMHQRAMTPTGCRSIG
jgi:hypothetical protein